MSELSVAVAALVVALVALFTALGQLLQAYLATADGYRRCQDSVMGLWAKETKLRWRWAEFRFETTFVIPRIVYRSPMGLPKEGIVDGEVFLTNTPANLEASMTFPGWEDKKAWAYYNSDNFCCWVALLAHLHRQSGNIVTDFMQHSAFRETTVSLPTVQFIRKSWDFMPPDIVRPMASTTVSDIAVMARRLGMIWKKFDPGESMRAEGNGHVFTSSIARSLGIILQYSFTARTKNDNSFYIPVVQADKLGFGLVEFDTALFGQGMLDFDLDIGSFNGLAQSFTLLLSKYQINLDRTEPMMLYVKTQMDKGDGGFIRGFNDLLPLCSRSLVLRLPTVGWMDRIPAPNIHSRGVTSSRAGFQVFTRKLEQLVSERGADASTQLTVTMRYSQNLNNAQYDALWHSGLEGDLQTRRHKVELRNLLIDYQVEMTKFLQESKVTYARLVIEHILSATIPAKSELPPPVNTVLWSEYLNWRHVASMEDYFKNLPEVIRLVVNQHQYYLTDSQVEDAWFSMIFKAICWQRCHIMIPNVPPLPSEYWNSKMPVYIG